MAFYQLDSSLLQIVRLVFLAFALFAMAYYASKAQYQKAAPVSGRYRRCQLSRR